MPINNAGLESVLFFRYFFKYTFVLSPKHTIRSLSPFPITLAVLFEKSKSSILQSTTSLTLQPVANKNSTNALSLVSLHAILNCSSSSISMIFSIA